MEFFGIFAFIMVLVLMGKMSRLERLLRENGIGSVRAAGLGEQVRKHIGRTVELTVEAGDFDVYGKECKILDADEDWALVLANVGKKTECEKLIRLDSVKSINVK